MKKLILLASILLFHGTTFAAIQEVVQEATGHGTTQQQAISEALLTAAQAVNGTSVQARTDYSETVNLTVQNNQWHYSSQISPVFSVENNAMGAVTKFQVLSLTGSKNDYRARVRAHVSKFQSSVQDQHLKRIAVLPFRIHTQQANHALNDELAELLGNYLSQSSQLSVLDRTYLEEMADENSILEWDGAPRELARIGQKVGADYLLMGNISQWSKADTNAMYGINRNADQVRLTWKVLEANTSKVVASGTLNRVISNTAIQNILSGSTNTASNQIAQQLAQDVLAKLKLNPIHDSYSPAEAIPERPITPGSSETPLKW